MRAEADTPLEERFLWIDARVSAASLEFFLQGLPDVRLPNTEIVFVGFAYADIPFVKEFDVVFPTGRPQQGQLCKSRIIAATQQMGKPFPEIPCGWRTVCLMQFMDGVPKAVQELPESDRFCQNDDAVCICDEATWECLKEMRK